MMFPLLDRLLSLGQSDTTPDRLARRIRVTNALALLGAFLSIASIPIDVIGAPHPLVIEDVAAAVAFLSCCFCNARGHHDAARVILLLSAHGVMLGGVLVLGGAAELRTVFFPLAIAPFLVFSVSERLWLAVTVAIPVVLYFATGTLPVRSGGLALHVNVVYAPLLAFTLIITGTALFAYIEHNADEKLARARERATQGARLVALGEMASGIAHEIRNPLAAIHLAATEVAVRPDDPVAVRQHGERIQRIVMRASRIIDALRSFSRDASGDPCVAAPVERIVGDAIELVGKRLAEHGVELAVGDIPAGLLVECRAVQLTQVIVNLLSNAYDAVSSVTNRSVTITVGTEGEHLEIAVSDSGPGIPPDVRARMFEPFFTTKAPDRGTGLGLSLSRGIVEAHHGTLELDTPSGPTRFVMRIPLVQARAT